MQKTKTVKRPTPAPSILDQMRATVKTGKAVLFERKPGGGFRDALAAEGLRMLVRRTFGGGYAVWVERRERSRDRRKRSAR